VVNASQHLIAVAKGLIRPAQSNSPHFQVSKGGRRMLLFQLIQPWYCPLWTENTVCTDAIVSKSRACYVKNGIEQTWWSWQLRTSGIIQLCFNQCKKAGWKAIHCSASSG